MSDAGSGPADLIERGRPLVRQIARDTRRRFGLRIELAELEAAGFEGLVQADRVFDPSRGVAFSTFATYRIRGAMLDNCRRLGLIRRQQRAEVVFAEAANDVLATSAEKAPRSGAPVTTASWIAEAFDDMAVAFALAEGRTPEPKSPRRDPEQQAERAELTERMLQNLAVLTEQERFTIEQYYFRGRRMAEIAAELEVSKSWVSRLHARALQKLRPVVLGKAGGSSG